MHPSVISSRLTPFYHQDYIGPPKTGLVHQVKSCGARQNVHLSLKWKKYIKL